MKHTAIHNTSLRIAIYQKIQVRLCLGAKGVEPNVKPK